jgi:hypothetical protein
MKTLKKSLIFSSVYCFMIFLLCKENEITIVCIDNSGEDTVFSKDEHFNIYVRGQLDSIKYNFLGKLNMVDYRIYIFVHPLNADGWWKQNKAEATNPWVAQAYLGGTGQYSAKNGEMFQIIAVITKEDLHDKYETRQEIINLKNTFEISPVKIVLIRR